VKKVLTFFLNLTFLVQGLAQSNPSEKPFQKIYVNYSFLPIPKGILYRNSSYDNFITGIDIFTKVSENWYGGITSYHLWLVLGGNDIFRYTQPFFITSIFTRHYFTEYPIKSFWETSVGIGNLCQCNSKATLIYTADGLYRTDNPAYHLGAGLGMDIKFTHGMIVRPNVKLFYLLNHIEEKRLHFRPFLTFQFTKRYRQSPIIFSPRF
jgi:hypothetical protein